MEPLSLAECRRQMSAFHLSLRRLSVDGTRAVTASFSSLGFRTKIVLVTVSVGGALWFFATRFFGEKETDQPKNEIGRPTSRAAARRAKRSLSYGWPELQREASHDPRDLLDVGGSEAAALVDGTPLTPQQLGLMGMEALETVVGYWEDALAAYNVDRAGPVKSLASPEENEFTKLLENLLDVAYQLQDEAEVTFIHEPGPRNNRLFESSNRRSAFDRESPVFHIYRSTVTPLPSAAAAASVDEGEATVTSWRSAVGSTQFGGGRTHLISVSTVDQDSFVSAQDTIADLRDFEDLEFTGEVTASDTELYNQALNHLERAGIPCRVLRTEFVGCAEDADYLAKLHCLRLGFKRIMENPVNRSWWADCGRQILSDLILKSDKDPKDFIVAYDEMLDFLEGPAENISTMAEELQSRNVKCTNFYDVALDYILIDSFEDLESPPSSVIAVMNNRWLSNGFKETAMQTAVWSVIAAKRRLLKIQDGFKSKFYNISEILLPILAWGFFGPDEELNKIMNYFKDQVLTLIRDLYSFQHIRYSSVDALAEDIMILARARIEQAIRQMNLSL